MLKPLTLIGLSKLVYLRISKLGSFIFFEKLLKRIEDNFLLNNKVKGNNFLTLLIAEPIYLKESY